MKRLLLFGCTIFLALFVAVPGHADLSVIGTGTMQGIAGNYQLIYDKVLNITWLDYTYTAGGNGMNPYTATNWAQGLSVKVSGANVTGWSLPTIQDLQFLDYNNLGNASNAIITGTGPFKNLLPGSPYWSGSTWGYWYLQGDWWYGYFAQDFLHGQSPANGGASGPGTGYYALAVTPGKVVPLPSALWLLGPGLVGLAAVRIRFGK